MFGDKDDASLSTTCEATSEKANRRGLCNVPDWLGSGEITLDRIHVILRPASLLSRTAADVEHRARRCVVPGGLEESTP